MRKLPTAPFRYHALLVLAACSGAPDDVEVVDLSESNIIGGDLASSGQFPSTVGLILPTYEDGTLDRLTCTMSKINDRTFLLAAHCLTRGKPPGSPIEPFFEPGAEIAIHHGVPLEPSKGESERFTTRVQDTAMHPSWREPQSGADTPPFPDADVAVIIVEDDTPTIPIGKVAYDTPVVGEQVLINGYGCDRAHHGVVGDLKFQLTEIDEMQDTMAYMVEGEFEDGELVGGVGICNGDSGGPLYRLASNDDIPRPGAIVGINSRLRDNTLFGTPIAPNESWTTRLDDAGKYNVAAWVHRRVCQADLNRDFQVNIFDLVLVGQAFGETSDPPGDRPEDVNEDGLINIFDLVIVSQSFGEPC